MIKSTLRVQRTSLEMIVIQPTSILFPPADSLRARRQVIGVRVSVNARGLRVRVILCRRIGRGNAGVVLAKARQRRHQHDHCHSDTHQIRGFMTHSSMPAYCIPVQVVREGGLEPPWVAPPDPKSGASAKFRHSRACEPNPTVQPILA